MKQKNIFIVISLIVLVAVAYFIFDKKSENVAPSESPAGQTQSSQPTPTNTPPVKNNMHTITIKTNHGEIQFQTYDADAPKTVKNFIDLAEKGFYDSLTFHRVIDGFMIQGGDPNCNPSTSSGPCGTGGPGYQFEDELNPEAESYKAGYKKGVVAMANAGANTNGSQFFIMVADYSLANNYTIFGKVSSGQEVVDKIAKVAKDSNDKPLEPVIIEKVTVK